MALALTFELSDQGILTPGMSRLQPHALDAIRGYTGRIEAYTCVFAHDMIKFMGEVKCPVMGLTSDGDS
jgi:hypothetical protein